MPRNLYTRNGEPSFNGYDPKLKKWGDHQFGWHNEGDGCINCNELTHYSLHRRYKFTTNMEKYSQKNYKYWSDRLWCCSEECWKKIVLDQLFELTIPVKNAKRALGGK